MHSVHKASNPSICAPSFPATKGQKVYRITYARYAKQGAQVIYNVRLYRAGHCENVVFPSPSVDSRLYGGALALMQDDLDLDGTTKPSHLQVLQEPDAETNLFLTVPQGWGCDPILINTAAQLVELMEPPYRHLFNAIFWDSIRFRKYCMSPSSMKHHHAYPSGNLSHSIDIARLMLSTNVLQSDPGFRILLALLHDAGKAIEYQVDPLGKLVMSEQGKLLGHKITIIQWVTEAIARFGIEDLSDTHVRAILHCLNSAPNAEWLGIRSPCMSEALFLSAIDRFSGQNDLLEQFEPIKAGWGKFCKHLNTTPFKLG